MKYGHCLQYGQQPFLKRLLSFCIGIKKRGYLKIMIPLPKETSQEEL